VCGQLVRGVPSKHVVPANRASQRLGSVSALGIPVHRPIDGLPDGETNELGSHPFLRGSDSLEIAGTPIVELDEDLFHMEVHMGPLLRGQAPQAASVSSRPATSWQDHLEPPMALACPA
jgi:hypothetical protein